MLPTGRPRPVLDDCYVQGRVVDQIHSLTNGKVISGICPFIVGINISNKLLQPGTNLLGTVFQKAEEVTVRGCLGSQLSRPYLHLKFLIDIPESLIPCMGAEILID